MVNIHDYAMVRAKISINDNSHSQDLSIISKRFSERISNRIIDTVQCININDFSGVVNEY